MITWHSISAQVLKQDWDCKKIIKIHPPTHTHSKETLKIRNQYEEVKQKWMTQSIRKQKSAGHRWRKGRMNEGLNELPGKSQQWVRRYLVCENTQTNTCFFCFCICNQGNDFWCVLSELFLQTNWRPTSNPTCYRVAIHKLLISFWRNVYISCGTFMVTHSANFNQFTAEIHIRKQIFYYCFNYIHHLFCCFLLEGF